MKTLLLFVFFPSLSRYVFPTHYLALRFTVSCQSSLGFLGFQHASFGSSVCVQCLELCNVYQLFIESHLWLCSLTLRYCSICALCQCSEFMVLYWGKGSFPVLPFLHVAPHASARHSLIRISLSSSLWPTRSGDVWRGGEAARVQEENAGAAG